MTHLRYDIQFINCRSILKDVLRRHDILSEVLPELNLFRQKHPIFSYVNDAVLVPIIRNLHKECSKVSIKARSTPASLSFKDQATKHITVK